MYKYFSGAGKVFLNTSQASPALERYQISNIYPAPEKYLNTHPAPEKPEKYLYTPNKTYITDHSIQSSEWTPSTSVHARPDPLGTTVVTYS